MKCPKCGKEIVNSSQYCEYCGAQVRRVENKTSIFWFITTLILSVIVICLCGFVYYEHVSVNEIIASEKEECNSRLCEEMAARQEAERQVAIAEQEKQTETRRIADLQSQVQNYANEITRLNELINRKDCDISSYRENSNDKEREISHYKKSLSDKDREISNLREQLPQIYKTKYDDELFLYKVNSIKNNIYFFEKTNRTFRGNFFTIYTQNNGYGLTEFGWIPMSKLEKY